MDIYETVNQGFYFRLQICILQRFYIISFLNEQAVIDARYLASLKNKFNYLHDRMRLSTTTIKSNLCNSMTEYHSMALINAINVERRKVGKHAIPASDDMCVTALLKGMVQKVYSLSNSQHQHFILKSKDAKFV